MINVRTTVLVANFNSLDWAINYRYIKRKEVKRSQDELLADST